jgi:hypothetical protein
MVYRWLVIAALLALGACANSGGAVVTDTGPSGILPAQFGLLLPAPADIARQASATGGQHCDGAQYDHAFSGLVAESGTAALFSPQWDPDGSGSRDVAYALYRLEIAETHSSADLQLHWQDVARYWIGLGHAGRNTWEWHSAPAGDNLALTLAPYRFGGTQVLVAVVALGTEAQTLQAVDLETASPGPLRKLFFLHHSTGWGLISEGNMRGAIDAYNAAHGESFELWDQGYNGDGPRDQNGDINGTLYDVPGDNTNPDGLYYLWTSPEADAVACRDGFLADYDVIAFKSCFPASAIYDDDMLEQYKTWYLGIRDFCDTHPEKLFVVMSTPPLVPEDTDYAQGVRARAFANWLKSATYLAGHPNIVCFDLFDELAVADAAETEPNTLKPAYRLAEPHNSHPNPLGNQTVGPLLAQFLIDSALAYTP